MLVGHTLKDRYRIYDRLGMGGAATVYLARDSETGQMVVVKVVHPHLVNEQFIGRFQREIDLLQQITNEHIIRLCDWGLKEFDEDLNEMLSYIVAEFVEGHTLADIIDARGPLEEPVALNIARQLAMGLDDIHQRGIVHRDVKSQNIMITPDNKAKLIDFGIAKGPNHATLTDPSHFAGTLYYAPPEQILETHGVDHRADIYSLGVVLYEMLTATLPVKAREFGTIASKIIAGDLDPITGVSEPVEQLVGQMLAHRADQRPSSASEIVKRIDAILDPGAPPETTQVPLPPLKLEQRFVIVTTDGRALPLMHNEVIIGRSSPHNPVPPDIDLWALGVEDARTASREHCSIFHDGDIYFVKDLGSMNGTKLNDQPLEPNTDYQLTPGDQITAGRVVLTFRPANNT